MTAARFRLQELIDARQLSQSELARRSGVAFSTVSKMCRNVSGQVSLATLGALAEVLGVEPGELIVRAPTEKASRKGRRTS